VILQKAREGGGKVQEKRRVLRSRRGSAWKTGRFLARRVTINYNALIPGEKGERTQREQGE